MNTKPRKMEALELLTLDKMTRKQRDWLDVLTALRAGHTEIVMQEGRYDSDLDAFSEAHQPGIITRLMDFDELWGYLNVPNYATSIDDCLKLFLPDAYVVFMQVNPNHCVCSVRPLEDILFTAAKEEAKTLPLAMLKAWWSIQD